MSEAAQIIIGVLSFITTITSVVVGYLIYNTKRLHERLSEVERRLDISHHKNFKLRIIINRLLDAFRAWRVSVLEMMEASEKENRPITREQIERLRKNSDPDEILKAGPDF